ncbi:hypothetical protein M430DRAFT_24237 [Amorphotheca resinae ATCC 22711]|jgi:hypothetical protein|uniref:Uncharacterized protein n=1 Tax=Amorphotheca resinae ATCC 22711 TaxID=857342 RepID=A0A2T3BEI8_AMORE|nr:hypothetical protein M430DRAFT_24237 [Amorphotheca resinae ATCC 22711]PSS27837.1 hypothetical protein M430DRAFT_24237 [Amorphotheca resinae ATCC 22711]
MPFLRSSHGGPQQRDLGDCNVGRGGRPGQATRAEERKRYIRGARRKWDGGADRKFRDLQGEPEGRFGRQIGGGVGGEEGRVLSSGREGDLGVGGGEEDVDDGG